MNEDRAVQSMRSVVYLQPGERRGCVGCHEPSVQPHLAAQPALALALRRPPSAIIPGPDGTRPFSYVRLVQPVLDRHCVACHDGRPGPGKSRLALTGQPLGKFTQSYENLRPYVRWYEWGSNSIGQIATRPGIMARTPVVCRIFSRTRRTRPLSLFQRRIGSDSTSGSTPTRRFTARTRRKSGERSSAGWR